MYTIEFWTKNPLPYDGAISIMAPSNISLKSDSYSCYVVLESRRVNDVCRFGESRMIKIAGAFRSAATRKYSGVYEYSGKV